MKKLYFIQNHDQREGGEKAKGAKTRVPIVPIMVAFTYLESRHLQLKKTRFNKLESRRFMNKGDDIRPYNKTTFITT